MFQGSHHHPFLARPSSDQDSFLFRIANGPYTFIEDLIRIVLMPAQLRHDVFTMIVNNRTHDQHAERMLREWTAVGALMDAGLSRELAEHIMLASP